MSTISRTLWFSRIWRVISALWHYYGELSSRKTGVTSNTFTRTMCRKWNGNCLLFTGFTVWGSRSGFHFQECCFFCPAWIFLSPAKRYRRWNTWNLSTLIHVSRRASKVVLGSIFTQSFFWDLQLKKNCLVTSHSKLTKAHTPWALEITSAVGKYAGATLNQQNMISSPGRRKSQLWHWNHLEQLEQPHQKASTTT